MMIDLPLPYDITEETIKLDPLSKTRTNPAVALMELCETVIINNDGDVDEEILERVARSAIILFHKEQGTFAQCLDTAVIWEVG
jgi:hypothetical protein